MRVSNSDEVVDLHMHADFRGQRIEHHNRDHVIPVGELEGGITGAGGNINTRDVTMQSDDLAVDGALEVRKFEVVRHLFFFYLSTMASYCEGKYKLFEKEL